MLACEMLFSLEKAKRAHELITEAVDGECPFLSGGLCPIAPLTLKVKPRTLQTKEAL